MIRTLRIAIATVLLLAAGNALALGLGQIEVKSRINQPLLAEIPIVSTTPGELQALQARLASPETFRRVGLEPPQGIAADLRFSLGNDARGRPVIRVTTVAPVNQAVLNFLIEVDWGQGRLVREYSALVDAPLTASAPLQPAISAPVVAMPNVVQRPVAAIPADPPVTQAPLPAEPRTTSAPPVAAVADPLPPPMPAAEPAPASSAITPPPRPQQPTTAPTPPREVVAALSVPPPADNVPSQYGPVKAGESLSKIASGLGQASAYSLDQTMVALLRANPDAFLNDNINLLRQGVVLRVPGSEDRRSIGADEAQLVVREQMQQWRQARRPVLQPDAAVAGNAPRRGLAPGNKAAARPSPSVSADTAKPTATPATTRKPATAPRQAQARLEIVPAAVAGKAAGTRSGTNAGGEGTMLQQQLQQRDEDLAARKAEITDLKERVAELETLKQQQDQLLAMKDSELAAAQQRLADARIAAAAVAAKPPAQAAASAAQTTQPAAEPPTDAGSFMPWLWGGLAILGVALLAWLFSRRRPDPVAPRARRGFDSEALAASMRSPVALEPVAPLTGDAGAEIDGVVPPPTAVDAGGHVLDATALPTTPTAPTTHVDAPTWHSGRWVNAEPQPDAVAPTASEPRFVPTAELPPEPLPEPASAVQRMKLARAFLDIGDEHSARQLLVELKEGAADSMLRSEASKLLRDLG